MATTEAAQQARRAYPHDLVKGAVVRVPAGPGYFQRPFGLRIAWREPVSRATAAITIGGQVLSQDGTTTRKRALYRKIVIATWMEPVKLLRKAPPPEYTAKIATLACPSPDPELGPLLATRWCVTDADGKPLPGEGTGPARIGDYVQLGDWQGKPTPWLAREFAEKSPAEQQLRRDPLDQCTDRVRQERGILRVERLTYDLSVWSHDSVMELVNGQWKCTYTCKRCGEKLKFINSSPWFAALEDGDAECHGETWVP